MTNKAKTGSESGFRTIREPGTIETPKQRARMSTDMFLSKKSKKKRR